MFLNISRFALQFYVFQLNYSLWEVVKVIRVSISITSLCSLNNFFDREPFWVNEVEGNSRNYREFAEEIRGKDQRL